MDDLIMGLTILSKYEHDNYNPTHCEHDVFMIFVDHNTVTEEDKKRLEELGFLTSDEEGEACFISFRFGSC